MKKLAAGILAHVDAGKTTLSEAMLYVGGGLRRLGRVDKGDAFFDSYELEKERGITIFSKQAILKWGELELTLLDTPGHVDFSAEMERAMQVMDYAILVVSGTEGIQEHTRTLWRLLGVYDIPVLIFINKMDVTGLTKGDLLKDLRTGLKGNFVDFGEAGTEAFDEQIALTAEEILDGYLETGSVCEAQIQELIRQRKVFPCFFGSALKLKGVEEFMTGLLTYAIPPSYPEAFGARVFKVSRDSRGSRLTHLKITGGSLKTKELVDGEKIHEIRLYSGNKFQAVKEAKAGAVCAVTGLSKACPGEGLGAEPSHSMTFMEPVMDYRLLLPEGTDEALAFSGLLQLEEEDPKLHLVWGGVRKEIHVRLMGQVQMEILKSLIAERFGLSAEFGSRSVRYLETIEDTVEGVGHFEPLCHYAEVHLLMEPGARGSGLKLESDCSSDVLLRSWQRLALSHLAEKEHRGVLTGSAITDMKITLVSGRAHEKHTEGGDFRQAVYRAVRQGLKQARSVLLEPYYDYRLEIPERLIGRAMSDVLRMSGTALPPSLEKGLAVLTGNAPAAAIDGYQQEVTAYSGGKGRLTLSFKGYGPCHNEAEVIAAKGYDPELDEENPADSIFCAQGSGFLVPWDRVFSYMHLECRKLEGEEEENRKAENSRGAGQGKDDRAEKQMRDWPGAEEVAAILERTFYANSRKKDGKGQAGWKRRERESGSFKVRRYPEEKKGKEHAGEIGEGPEKGGRGKKKHSEEYLLVDGYNIIFAWEELRELAGLSIDGARGRLLDILCNYQGMKQCRIIAVFDAYRVQGHVTECFDYHNIQVVFTKEAETADGFIEKFAHENGKKYDVAVATSDRLEQIIIQGQGCRVISAGGLMEEILAVNEELRQELQEKGETVGRKSYLLDSVSERTLRQLKELSEE